MLGTQPRSQDLNRWTANPASYVVGEDEPAGFTDSVIARVTDDEVDLAMERKRLPLGVFHS